MNEGDTYLRILSLLKKHHDADASAYVSSNMLREELEESESELRRHIENLEMNRYVEKLEGAPIAETYLVRIRHKGIEALLAEAAPIVKECRLHGPQKIKILKILRDEGFYVPEKTILDKLGLSKEETKIYADELEYCGLAKRVEAMYPNFTLKITDEGMEYLKNNEGKTAHKPKFEMYKKGKEFHFRLKAPNGEEIAQSQSYDSKSNCMKGIESVKRNAAIAEIIDLNEE